MLAGIVHMAMQTSSKPESGLQEIAAQAFVHMTIEPMAVRNRMPH